MFSIAFSFVMESVVLPAFGIDQVRGAYGEGVLERVADRTDRDHGDQGGVWGPMFRV